MAFGPHVGTHEVLRLLHGLLLRPEHALIHDWIRLPVLLDHIAQGFQAFFLLIELDCPQLGFGNKLLLLDGTLQFVFSRCNCLAAQGQLSEVHAKWQVVLVLVLFDRLRFLAGLRHRVFLLLLLAKLQSIQF